MNTVVARAAAAPVPVYQLGTELVPLSHTDSVGFVEQSKKKLKENFRKKYTLPLDHLNPGLRSVMSSPGGGKLAPGEKSSLFRGGDAKAPLVLIGGLILRGPQNGPD